MLSIQTNVNSMNAQENLRLTNQFQGRTITRLTSGYRINEAGDDAAGLAVANVYRSDVAELVQGVRNANDGLSTLQIVDGGLNNISKMLDRLKTLATQSASATFTGDRTTLNKEYQDVLNEIDRQAGMVGLASTGPKETRNNTDIGVYVGGSKQGTAKVTIELSGGANQVDSVGLNLKGTVISGGGATTFGSAVIANKTDLLASTGADGEQVFTFTTAKNNEAPVTFNVSVKATTNAGITTNDALAQLNSALNTHGISASLDVQGILQFSSDDAFSVSSAGALAGTGTTGAIGTVNTTKTNSAMYTVTSTGDLATDATETLTFKVGGQSVTVTPNANGAQNIADAINAKTNALGIYAIVSGATLSFQSKADFDIDVTGSTVTTGVFTAAGASSAGASRSNSATLTSGAEAAITSIQNAVSALGLVQGKVGTAQNKLSYAIQLAQSQITSFSAAESRIRDADVAQEAANLTKAQVLQQASLAALAQANSAPQAVLSLLRG
jgi:flagellin